MSRQIDWQKTIPIWQENRKIIAAWAFGSAQDGVVREEGDLDTAVFTTTPLTLDEQLTLLGKLQAALQFEDVDLVILNDANPILRFEAVSGKRLFCRDLSAMAGFVSLTAREYEDEMAQWQMALQKYY
jgi:predicted nucleotidyltransferase